MVEVRNDTPWQQGFVLSPDSAAKFGLIHPDAQSETITVVITHVRHWSRDRVRDYCKSKGWKVSAVWEMECL